MQPAFGVDSVSAGAAARLPNLPCCPIPEITRFGRTLRRWRTAFLAYFDTASASNGGTEGICE